VTISRLHALILDDHSTSALSLKAALSVMGFSTFGFAATGHQALAAARARKPDLVVTSLSMRDGLDAEVLSAFSEEIEGAPVIYTCEADAEPGGTDPVLQKPIGRAALVRALESIGSFAPA
jgi:DNA-binding NarL/FixJ family response regulator